MGNSQQADLDQYNALQMQLDSNRVQFSDHTVMEPRAAHNKLFWLEFPGTFDPKLDSYDDATAMKRQYAWSIGPGDAYNYESDGTIIATSAKTGDTLTYTAYDPNSGQTLGQTTLPAPTMGEKWWAYAVNAGNVYIVQTVAGSHALLRWTPGQTPTTLTTLEAAGAMVGEFMEFDVEGTTMIFVESGRIWKLDLSSNQASWLMNMKQASGTIDFQADGVLFAASTSTQFFNYATGALTDVSAEIKAASYRFNTTYAMMHYESGTGFTRYKSWMVYLGQSGLFAFDLFTQKITPLLLSPNSATLRVDYMNPTVLDDGTLFINGLQSTSGAVGTDGPAYKVDLKTLLK